MLFVLSFVAVVIIVTMAHTIIMQGVSMIIVFFKYMTDTINRQVVSIQNYSRAF